MSAHLPVHMVTHMSLCRHNTLATMLGAKQGSDDELDAVFDRLDSDKSNSITRTEWLDFVEPRMKARMRAPKRATRAHACMHAAWTPAACMRSCQACMRSARTHRRNPGCTDSMPAGAQAHRRIFLLRKMWARTRIS